MASLNLILTDAAGNDLEDHITVDLFAHSTSAQYQVNSDIKGSLRIDGIDVAGSPVYRVMITPANHRMIQAFVSLSDGNVTDFKAAVPVDPGKVRGIAGPDFAGLSGGARAILNQSRVPLFNDGQGGFLQGPQLYAALDRFPLLKACFLNITAKSAATMLPDGQAVLDHMLGLVRLEQDRLFMNVTAALVEETGQSNAFHAVNSVLHDPLPGYTIISSFKTFDKYGNLQLTFQRKGDTGTDYAVDVDIDDAQGIEHIFQVVRNSVKGPTNPYDIHDILLQQSPAVDPGYEFQFAMAAQAG
jgi:hypothetical protein